MNRLLFIYSALLLSCMNNKVDDKSETKTIVIPFASTTDTCIDFNSLNTKIRDGLIPQKEALKKMQVLIPLIRNYYYKHNGQDFQKSAWIFPLQNYNAKAIGGKDGSGYIASGFNYFDGNKHGGHPSQDIFINDKNQDCLDDVTKKPVNVLSLTEGIVIAASTQWDTASNLRGGKYIYIYVPSINSFIYYAHTNKVLVNLCDIIKPGDIIANVGRTGLSAFKKRSPTHLHIMQLKLDSTYYPRPVNLYKDLLTIQTQKK